MPIELTYTQLNDICENAINSCPAHLPDIKACLELCLQTGVRIEESYNRSRWSITAGGLYILSSSKESNPRIFEPENLPVEWKCSYSDPHLLPKYVNYRKVQYFLNSVISKHALKVLDKSCLTHIFRHTYVQAQKFFGATIEEVQKLIGHKSLSSTERYFNGVVTADNF